MSNAWTRYRAECRRRFGPDPWQTGIDNAFETDEFPPGARLRGPTRRLLFLTKDSFRWRLDEKEPEVRDADYWLRYGIPTKPFLATWRKIVGHYPTIRFLGDLDPGDLALFRAYQCGSPDMEPLLDWNLPIAFAGLTSEWMDLVQEWEVDVERRTIRMSRMEREQYKALSAVWPELGGVIGARAQALLNGGRKLEVEGALLTVMHDRAFRRRMLDLIFGDVERRALLRAILTGQATEAFDAARKLDPSALEASPLIDLMQSRTAPLVNRKAAVLALRDATATPTHSGTFWDVARDRANPASLRGDALEAMGSALFAQDRRRAEFRWTVCDLVDLLDDPSPEVRFWTVFALGNARATAALPRLRKMARTDKGHVRHWWSVAEEARDAIQSINTGRWPDREKRSSGRGAR